MCVAGDHPQRIGATRKEEVVEPPDWQQGSFEGRSNGLHDGESQAWQSSGVQSFVKAGVSLQNLETSPTLVFGFPPPLKQVADDCFIPESRAGVVACISLGIEQLYTKRSVWIPKKVVE